MKKHIIILILVFLNCERVPSDKELYFQASDLENSNAINEANRIHDKILNRNPNFRPSLINRGANKSFLGDYHGAILDYKRIIKFDNDNTLDLSNIANNFKKLQLKDSAIHYYSKAIKAAKKQELIFIEMNGDFDKDFQYYINLDELRFEKASTHREMNDSINATLEFEKIIQSKNTIFDGTAYYYVGKSYLYLKDTLNACLMFKKAMKNGVISGIELNELVEINKLCSK